MIAPRLLVVRSRILRTWILLFAAMVLGAAGAYAIVVPGMVRHELEERVIPALERACACQIDVASIDVGFGGVTLAGVELDERGAPWPSRAGRHVRVDRVHLAVDWFAALWGEAEVRTVVVERPRIVWPVGAALFPGRERAAAATRRSHRLPALPERLSVRDGAVELVGADARIRARVRVDGDVWWSHRDLRADLRLDELVLSHRSLAGEAVAFAPMSLRLHGSLSADARTLRIGELRVSSAGVELRVRGQLGIARRPRLVASLAIPRVACASVQHALPRALGHWIRRHPVEGTFSLALDVRLDWARPGFTRVGGSVRLDECRWAAVPEEVRRALDLATLAGQRPEYVPIHDLPPYVPWSVIVREDPGFHAHHGILPASLVRALRTNLRAGEIRSGGSTITMQLAKNVFLGHDRTVARKLDELFLAHQLENLLTKNQILELYLNVIEFGPGVFGIGPAARHYFGKDARDLDLTEGAFLSSVIPAPTRRHDQLCRGELSEEGRAAVQRVLEGLRWTRHIEMAEYDAAISSPLDFSRGRGARDGACAALR